MIEFACTLAIILGIMLAVAFLAAPASIGWRALSQAALYVVIFAFCIAPPWLMLTVTALLIALATYEVYRAALASGVGLRRACVLRYALLILAPLLAPGICWGWGVELVYLSLITVFAILILRQDVEQPLQKAAIAAIALGIAAGLSCFPLLQALPNGPALCLFAFFLINLSDSFAMLVGTACGRHRLCPRLSPGKTWEGVMGSLVLTLPLAVLFNHQLALGLSWPVALTAGLVLNIGALLGDLTASLFKRQAAIKDFGKLIPGHGGILDRFDSSIMALPAWYFFTLHVG